MPKEPLGPSHHEGPRQPERRSRLGEQAIQYATQILRDAPSATVFASGSYVQQSGESGSYRTFEFRHNSQRGNYKPTLEEFVLRASIGTDNDAALDRPVTEYYVGKDNRMHVNSSSRHFLEILRSEEYRRGEYKGILAVREAAFALASADRAAGRDIAPLEDVEALLAEVEAAMGDRWQAKPEPGSTLVERFKQAVTAHAVDSREQMTRWQDRDNRTFEIILSDEHGVEGTEVNLSDLDSESLTENQRWVFTPSSEAWYPDYEERISNMMSPSPNPVDGQKIIDGVAVLQYAAAHFGNRQRDFLANERLEAAKQPDLASLAEAYRYAREIHSRDPLKFTRFESMLLALPRGAEGEPRKLSVRFGKEVVSVVDGTIEVPVIEIVTEGADGKVRPEIRYVGLEGNMYEKDFVALRMMAEKLLDTEQYPAVEDYRAQEERGENRLTSEQMLAELKIIQAGVGKAWPMDLTGYEDLPDLLYSDIVDAGITETPHRTLQQTSWMHEGHDFTVETSLDDKNEPVSVILSEELPIGGAPAYDQKVWIYAADRAPEYKHLIWVNGEVPDGPQRAILRDLIQSNAETVLAKMVGKYLPASEDEKAQGLSNLRQGVMQVRSEASERARPGHMGSALDAGIERAFYGEDARVPENPEERRQANQGAEAQEGEKGGAWTAGSHRSDDSGNRTPRVEMRGDDGEVHEIHPDEGDEPESGKSNGRE